MALASGLRATTAVTGIAGSARPGNPSALAVVLVLVFVFVFAVAFLVVIPRDAGNLPLTLPLFLFLQLQLQLPFWLSFPREAGNLLLTLPLPSFLFCSCLFGCHSSAKRGNLLLALPLFLFLQLQLPLWLSFLREAGESASKRPDACSVRIENKSSKSGKFFNTKNHHTRTTQNSTIYHQFTTFYQPKTTSKSSYPPTLAL
jgi:hypothetical protein